MSNEREMVSADEARAHADAVMTATAKARARLARKDGE